MGLQEVIDDGFDMVSANDYAVEALRRMRLKDLPWMFVLERNAVTGIVLAQELACFPEEALGEHDVRRYLSADVLMIGAETEPQQAERLLRYSGRRFLAVVQNDWPVGVFTLDSLARLGREWQRPAYARRETFSGRRAG